MWVSCNFVFAVMSRLFSPLVCHRADRETAARITEEIGNLMKEIETMVEEKKKDSSDMNKIILPEEGQPPTFIWILNYSPAARSFYHA